MEYISREALPKKRQRGFFLDEDFNAGWNACLREVEQITAADVRPVVRGHIEEDENTYLFCSECNCDITLAAYETPDNRLVLRPNFCPNCGADMREES